MFEHYNPANFGGLTDAQKDAMKELTASDIAQLAKTYPNTPNGKTYIVLFDKTKPLAQQLFPESTWQNLHELHKIGQAQFAAYGPKKAFTRPIEGKTAPMQDLTNGQAKEELTRNVTTAAPQNATFAKDQSDKLLNTTEGQGSTGALQEGIRQGGDIAGNGQTGTKDVIQQFNENQGTTDQGTKEETEEEGFEDEVEVPLSELLKPGVQEKYEEAFGVKPKESITKQALIDALNSGTPIED